MVARLRLALVVVFLGMVMLIPSTDAATSTPTNYDEDYIDNNTSNVDSVVDNGTHTSFDDEKTYDSTYDTLTEENTGGAGSDTEDFVDQLGTSHTPADIGTHSDWTELQDEDDTYDTLTEGDTGGSGVDENVFVDTAPTALWTQTGTTPYLDSANYPTSYISTSSNGLTSGWYSFGSTTASGSGCTVTLSVMVWQGDDDDCDWQLDWTNDGTADASGTFTDPVSQTYKTTSTISGLDTETEINACRVRFTFTKGGGSPTTMYIDAAYLRVVQAGGSVYDLDLELGWTNAPYTEDNVYLCVDAGAFSGESLQVDVWDEVSTNDWVNLDTTVTASDWNNYSISAYINSGTVEIRFWDTSDDSTAQDTWQIDCVLIHGWSAGADNYELDLEVQFTSQDYDDTIEYLCIATGTLGSEDSETIKVYCWYSSAWQDLGTLSGSTWNNVSVASYLTGDTFTLRFLAQTEESDTTQSTFQIDAVLLRTHSYAYAETRTDTLQLASAVASEVGKTFSDTIQLASVSVFELGKVLTDTLQLASEITKSISISLEDTLGISSAHMLGIAIALLDTLGLASTYSTAIVIQKIVEDTLELASGFSNVVGLVLGDTIQLASTHSLVQSIVKTFADTITVASVSAVVAKKQLTDTLQFASDATRAVGLVLSDTLQLTSAYSVSISRVLSDTLQLASGATPIKNPGGGTEYKTVYDTLQLGSSIANEIARTLTDTIQLASDQFVTVVLTLSDGVVLASASSYVATLHRTFEDILQIVSSVPGMPEGGGNYYVNPPTTTEGVGPVVTVLIPDYGLIYIGAAAVGAPCVIVVAYISWRAGGRKAKMPEIPKIIGGDGPRKKRRRPKVNRTPRKRKSQRRR